MNTKSSHNKSKWLLNFIINNFFYFVFFAVFIYFSAASSKFLTMSNISNLLLQCSYYGILVTGISFVIISRDFDISVGAIAYVSMSVGMTAITNNGYPIIIGLILTLITGALMGLVNGIVITRLKVPSFIMTLGMLIAGRGVGHLLVAETGGIAVPKIMAQFSTYRIGPFYYEVLIMLAVMAIGQIILSKTVFGKIIFAIGDNEKSAEHLGININNIRVILFVLSGFIASLAGIVYVTQVGYLPATFADGWEFTAISMAVIGGISLFGGRGAILPGALLGIVLIVMLQNGLTIIGISPYVHPFVTGLVIFLAILADSFKNRNHQN